MPVSAPKGLGMAFAAGATSGVVVLSAISGGGLGMALAYLTPLPLLLIGLAFGGLPCLGAAVIGAVVVAVAGLAALPAYLAIGAWPALLLTLAAVHGRRDTGGLLVALAAGAVLVMGLLALALPVGEAGIEAWLKSQAEPMIEAGLPGAAAEVKATVTAMWIAVLPALVGAAWFAMTMVDGVIAQWAVSRAGHAMVATPRYAEVRLPLWLALAALGLGASSLAGGDAGFLARNAAIVLLLPYLMAGVADLHGVLRKKPNGTLWLGLFYGVFFALFGWAAMAVTAWGLVRQCVRSRRQDPAQDQEDSDGSHSA
jgi:hypothetical protein